MRLWSLHPKYLDAKGLVAAWRETLLAQKVLQGLTKGYKKHPQLIRFQSSDQPMQAISSYLLSVWEEADVRGYKFDKDKISVSDPSHSKIAVTKGQIQYEMKHLLTKLKTRDTKRFNTFVHGKSVVKEEDEDEEHVSDEESKDKLNQEELVKIEEFIAKEIEVHPLFEVVEGQIEAWEKLEVVKKPTPRKRKRKTSDDDDSNQKKKGKKKKRE